MNILDLLPNDTTPAPRNDARISSIRHLLGDVDGALGGYANEQRIKDGVRLAAAMAMIVSGEDGLDIDEFTAPFGEIKTRERAVNVIRASLHALSFTHLSAKHLGDAAAEDAAREAILALREELDRSYGNGHPQKDIKRVGIAIELLPFGLVKAELVYSSIEYARRHLEDYRIRMMAALKPKLPDIKTLQKHMAGAHGRFRR